jgi:hypothetical protein
MSIKIALAKEGVLLDTKSNSQVYNPATGNYILRDGISGKFTKTSYRKSFRGVPIEPQIISAERLPIPRSVAIKAEKAVIALVNGEL